MKTAREIEQYTGNKIKEIYNGRRIDQLDKAEVKLIQKYGIIRNRAAECSYNQDGGDEHMIGFLVCYTDPEQDGEPGTVMFAVASDVLDFANS